MNMFTEDQMYRFLLLRAARRASAYYEEQAGEYEYRVELSAGAERRKAELLRDAARRRRDVFERLRRTEFDRWPTEEVLYLEGDPDVADFIRAVGDA